MPYPNVEPQPNFPALEEAVLDYWAGDGTFKASIEAREAGLKGENEFVFYDGPPFANGLPHYGHLLTGYVKDAVPRYQTMRGKRVERRFGWDCHGLPAEVEAEKELGVSGHPGITEFGIDKFNAACRTSVLRYTDEWERYVTRQARWVDFENDYKTLDVTYMESVMWAFHTLWDKGLIYEGFRVLAYCWRCETPLSNTETRMDDVYRDRQDPALTVWFQLENGLRLLVWTTTPWTLPSNLALAVNPDLDYAVVTHSDGHDYVIGEARLSAYERELGEVESPRTIKGHDLVGLKYAPMFSYFTSTENAFQVIGAEFVSAEDGTGIVHLAPGFGEDDQTTCQSANIPTICPMDEHGQYTAEVTDWSGRHVFEANTDVIRHLKETGVVVRHDTYNHSYPHCWRCAEPLVYRAMSSWFVKVTAIKDRMLELNREITWVPEHLQDGSFGKWLANARDWAISRNRFWGSPIPVWKSDDPNYPRIDVYGSIQQLQDDFGMDVTDLHRPQIDDLVRPNPDDPTGKSMMRRVPEVLDCWFESGSMPFAQVHYPFENQEWFENHYPGDFIVEYIGQTRGWFYTLHVLATALFDRPAFANCVSHGIVLGDDGQKMSKSLRNYPDPMKVFDTYGADAMRWYLLSSSILRGGDFSVTESGIKETVRQILLPMWNSWYFLTLYANAENREGQLSLASDHVMDRYIFAKASELVASTTRTMDANDLFGACAEVRSFLDALTNWYIRRSRDRFWAGDQDAINTLHSVLHILCRVTAPMLPLTSEVIFRGLTGARSVHLESWPDANDLPNDVHLAKTMDAVRDVCSTTLSLRKASARRVRLPLASVTIASAAAPSLQQFTELIADETNVKDVRLVDDVASVAAEVIQLVPAIAGPRLGPNTQKVIAAIKKGDWTLSGDGIDVAGVTLQPDEFTRKFVATSANEGTASAALGSGAGVVLLDTVVTPELEAEGSARDLMRAVQQARRDAGFDVSDRIRLRVTAEASLIEKVKSFESVIAAETLSLEVNWVIGASDAQENGELDGIKFWLMVERSTSNA
jgi:isoleucyl-tRNA synthetase